MAGGGRDGDETADKGPGDTVGGITWIAVVEDLEHAWPGLSAVLRGVVNRRKPRLFGGVHYDAFSGKCVKTCYEALGSATVRWGVLSTLDWSSGMQIHRRSSVAHKFGHYFPFILTYQTAEGIAMSVSVCASCGTALLGQTSYTTTDSR